MPTFFTFTNNTILVFIILFLSGLTETYAAYSVQDGMNKGYITLSASSSSGYSETKIIITNKISSSVDIDFSTVWLIQNNDSQRIGLAYEKRTGSYILRFNAGKTYTLYFSSRCLDRNRHSPTTGSSYIKISTIGSQFDKIINALRNNYSQGDVWNITDYSGTFSQLWKSADPRYVPPIQVNQKYIQLSGTASWATSGNSISIKAEKLSNNSLTTTTGSLRLKIWATRSPYTGGTINGYVMGSWQLNPLKPNYSYSNLSSGNIAYTTPPKGTYYTTLTVEEYSNNYWYIKDYINFNGTTTF